jgi:hypothetical protein
MDSIIQKLLSWEFLVFCLAVFSITFVIRKFIDYAVDHVRSLKKFHNFTMEVLMPTIPVFVGGILAWTVDNYPYPEGLDSVGGRVFFGMVAGMFSGLVYRIVKSFLTKSISSIKNN